MTRVKTTYYTKSYFSKSTDNGNIIVGFAIQPNDVVKYDDIANNIVTILRKSKGEDYFVEDIIKRLNNCPEYFKNNLHDSLFVKLDSETVEGNLIHSIRDNNIIKVYYKQKPCVLFKYSNQRYWLRAIILIFVAIIVTFVFSDKFIREKTGTTPQNQQEALHKENANETKNDENSKISNTYTIDNKDTLLVITESDNIFKEDKNEIVSEPSSTNSSYRTTSPTSSNNVQESSRRETRSNNTDPSHENEKFNNSLRLFEDYKSKGDKCYKSFFNGDEKSRVEAIKYYKKALEIKNDESIQIRLKKLQDFQ